jgi:hypothetical protein
MLFNLLSANTALCCRAEKFQTEPVPWLYSLVHHSNKAGTTAQQHRLLTMQNSSSAGVLTRVMASSQDHRSEVQGENKKFFS